MQKNRQTDAQTDKHHCKPYPVTTIGMGNQVRCHELQAKIIQ